MDKEQIKKILQATQVKPLAKELKTTKGYLYNIRHAYKLILEGRDKEAKVRSSDYLYKILKEIVNEEKGIDSTKEEKPAIENQAIPDSFEQLGKLFEEFQSKLANTLADLVKDLTSEEIEKQVDKNKRKWKAEGALEQQAIFIEESKKDNLGNMLKRRLLGEK